MWGERIFLLLVTTSIYEYHLVGKAVGQTSTNDPSENVGGDVTQSIPFTTSQPKPWSQFEKSRPWYRNQDMIKLFIETNRSMAEYARFETMLGEIESVLDPKTPKWVNKLVVHLGFNQRIVPSTYVQNVASELSLCSQEDTTWRISCMDRCGQSPETREGPAHCGCDLDCFVFGDCCEDINKVCPGVFVEAIQRFYVHLENFSPPHCVRRGRHILKDLIELEQTDSSNNPRVFEINCYSKLKTELAVSNIHQALSTSQCIMKNPKIDHLTWSRTCSRPDVIVCPEMYAPSGDYINFWYPVSLLCYKLRINYRTVLKYLIRDFDGMEVISKYGNCHHLRSTLTTQAIGQDDDNASSRRWRRTRFEKLKLAVVSLKKESLFVFESKDLWHLRCVLARRDLSVKCELLECSDTQLVNGTFQPCYLPDSVSLMFSANEKYTANFMMSHGSVNNNSLVPDSTNNCLCFQAQTVLNMVGLWQPLIDTGALLKSGQCKIRLRTSSRGQTQRVSIDLTSGDGEMKENLTGNNLLAQHLLNLWLNHSNECSEATNKFVNMCLFNTKFWEIKTCFSLQQPLPRSNMKAPNRSRSGAPKIHDKWFILLLVKTSVLLFVLN